MEPLAKSGELSIFGASDGATRIRRTRYLNETRITVHHCRGNLAGQSHWCATRSMLAHSLHHNLPKKRGFSITNTEDRGA